MKYAICALLLALTFVRSAQASSSDTYSCAASGPTGAFASARITKEQAQEFKRDMKAAGATVVQCTKD